MSIPKAVFPPAFAGVGSPVTAVVRRLVASGLTSASIVLARLAASLVEPARAPSSCLPRLEFHAEAGAPEGALYIDGEWVGYLPGVRRL